MKILIIKTGALGDVVRTSFIAQALNDKYHKSNPKIYWITDEKAKPLFANNPYVFRTISSKDKNLVETIRFDLIVNLEEDEENCKFALSLKPKKIMGFIARDGKIVATPTAREWYNMSLLGKRPQNDLLKKKNKKTHRQIMGEIVEVDWKRYEPFLRLNNYQRNLAKDFLRRHNLSRSDLIVGINTGAADRWPKHLSMKKTADLINRLYKEFNAKILLFGGPNEINRNREIIKMSKAPVIDTGCGNDLVEFPALISVCSVFITTDSLGLHIALALKRKTISLIGPTSASEIDLYGLGDKVIAKSNCLCCYSADCKSMEKLDIKEITSSIKKMINPKITFLITAFKEPKTIGRAVEAALNQKTDKKFDILVSAPDNETLNAVKKYQARHKNLYLFKDPGKGKVFALNMLFESLKTDILILTDGDVYVSENSVEDLSNLFLDPEIGCATGRPTPTESKRTKYGYWANFLFYSAHKLRKAAFESNSFIECSGYLFAFRKGKINRIPLDVAEDTLIPYLFWERGYKIGYAEDAKVYVINPTNLKDWIKQKVRTSKAHEKLSHYVDTRTTPRVKSFSTEANGIFWALGYPSNPKEFLWTFELIFARLYMWAKVFLDTRFLNKHYGDAWERVESTK